MGAALPGLLEHDVLPIVFAVVLIDQLGIPIPAVPVLVAAGTLAAAGRASAAALFAAAVLACVLADGLWFAIGRRYGMRVLKTLCRIAVEPDSCVSETQGRFERWGVNSLIIAKFIPGLAIIAPPLAGAMRIGWLRFASLSLAGAALWAAVGLGAGMAFKSQLEQLASRLVRIGGLAIAAVAVAFAFYLIYKWQHRRRFLAQLRMARIGVDELYAMLEAGKEPVILDVRTHTARGLEPRWIPTAIHAPIAEIAQRLAELPRDREIIVYCTCPNEASAALVAKQLMVHGFVRVRPLHGGLDAWIAAGYAVASPAISAAGWPSPDASRLEPARAAEAVSRGSDRSPSRRS
jgi:membrane protein DedA with SNARE-associated domain/rhodanese-related sulfurtransferase